MKHEFNVPPVVPAIREAKKEMCRDASCWMESDPRSIPNWRSAARDRTSRCNYEIPITLLARASRKHMRLVAALTEKHGRGTGSRAGWSLIYPKLPAGMAR
jgi:hypothetical protein